MFNPILDYLKNMTIEPKINQQKILEKTEVKNTQETSSVINSASKVNPLNTPKQTSLNLVNNHLPINVGISPSPTSTDTLNVSSSTPAVAKFTTERREFELNDSKSLGNYISEWK